MSEKEKDISQLQEKWQRLEAILREQFGKKVGMEGILFLIGMREVGLKPREFTKEEKQDLMHVAICAIFEPAGYYKLSHQDQEGWPHWESIRPLPYIDIFSQEIWLKSHIIDYFENVYELD